ncbi:hypothetical protein MNBD_GAMMA08-2637 [hydrothermal vent metagenome]|uniref:Beta-ketoacyl synthase-like N-terminal domain-containing protein n=1 Tax=hydrothermal vent metagenome TaxID=652676 RepID=A0A3B0WUE5_9ZZZZ
MSARSSSVVLTSIGALTPLGADAKSSCAAIDAGISRVTEHVYFACTPDDPEWDQSLPLFSATVPTIDPLLDSLERFYELALPALTETFESANLNRADLTKTALYLSLPQTDEITFNMGFSNFIPELCKRTGLSGLADTCINQLGHTGVFALINRAVDSLEAGTLNYCIVGGVDSYLLSDRLAFLDKNWRIRSDRNVDGFIPGEASVMLMLETEANAKQRGANIIAKISAISEAEEPNVIYSEKTSSGSGLTEAIRGILDQTGTNNCFESVYCSLNGESYYAFEWGLQLTRLNKAFEKMNNLVHPAEYVGDVGAATGGLLIACAATALQQGVLADNKALLWTSADDNKRMALCLKQA